MSKPPVPALLLGLRRSGSIKIRRIHKENRFYSMENDNMDNVAGGMAHHVQYCTRCGENTTRQQRKHVPSCVDTHRRRVTPLNASELPSQDPEVHKPRIWDAHSGRLDGHVDYNGQAIHYVPSSQPVAHGHSHPGVGLFHFQPAPVDLPAVALASGLLPPKSAPVQHSCCGHGTDRLQQLNFQRRDQGIRSRTWSIAFRDGFRKRWMPSDISRCDG